MVPAEFKLLSNVGVKIVMQLIPAQLFDEMLSISSDFSWKFDSINSSENYVVGLHGLLRGEWWPTVVKGIPL